MTEAALIRLVNDLASMPLDHSLPLWQAYVVDDVEGGSALITRCHHCMADGTAMMTVTQRLFDPAPGAQAHAGAARPGGQRRQRGRQGLVRAGDRPDHRRGARRRRAGRRGGHAGGRTAAGRRPAVAAEGRVRAGQARGLVAAGRHSRHQGDRQALRRQGQRRAGGRHDRRVAHLPEGARRRREPHDGARDGAGRPAPARAHRAAGQRVRPGAARPGRDRRPAPTVGWR